ncbi:hypothetical protein ABHI18_005361 [Aspergillus niger]
MLEFYSRLAVLGLLAVFGYAFTRREKPDPREPPLVRSSIPVVGHLLGFLWYGLSYFTMMTEKHAYPIFGLNMVFTKSYLVTSPSILQSIQRNKKSLSFDPFLSMAAERMVGIRGPTLELMREKQSGGQGLKQAVIHAMQPTLIGASLDRMNERMARLLRPLVDDLASTSTVDLYGWCRHAITVASTNASYGPLNPYQDAKIEESFWSFESHLSPLMANFLPWLTARTAWRGREAVVAGLVRYYEQGGHEDGSEMTQVRWKTMREAGVATEEIAREEVGMGIGLLSNTVPAAFWVLYELYSRPDLLEEIREEIRRNALRVDADQRHIIDISAIRDNCPLVVSSFQEILRVQSASAPTRFVMEDVMLADQYFLKAGSMINMPAATLGRMPEAWGETAREFDARRYMRSDDKNPRRTGGFMTFGVSPVICPGRHFASSEILGLAALLVLRYDIAPVDGQWRTPRLNSMAVASNMRPLKDEFPVTVRPRSEYAGVQWDCTVQPGSGVFNLMVG